MHVYYLYKKKQILLQKPNIWAPVPNTLLLKNQLHRNKIVDRKQMETSI